MSNPLPELAPLIQFDTMFLDKQVEGFAGDHWTTRFGESNHALWIVGHVACYRRMMARMLGVTVAEQPWETAFPVKSQPNDGDAYDIAELLADVHAMGELLVERLMTATEDLANSSPPRQTPDGSQTIGGVVRFMQIHEMYHIGQLAFIRGALGMEGVR